MKLEIETFKNIGSYEIENLKKNEPSAINFLSYRKYKISIELIEESKEVLIKRLEELLESNKNNYNRRAIIKDELKKLNK